MMKFKNSHRISFTKKISIVITTENVYFKVVAKGGCVCFMSCTYFFPSGF